MGVSEEAMAASIASIAKAEKEEAERPDIGRSAWA